MLIQGESMLISAILIILISSGCIGDDPVKKAVKALDDAIFNLGNANADWQTIVEETRDKLTDEAQSTVRNEISDTLTRAIGASGMEFRCDADFIRARVRQDLIRIRAKLTGETPPVNIPVVCQINPTIGIDFNREPNSRPALEFYGYDFDADIKPTVHLLSRDGTLKNVSEHLAIPHHYQAILNIGGNGVPLSLNSKKLVMKWGNNTLSEVPIISPKCAELVEEGERKEIHFNPPHTLGDAEFGGCGPNVWVDVTPVNHEGKYVSVSVHMKAEETGNDWTTAEGSTEVEIFRPKYGYEVKKILAEPTHSYYKDTNLAPDILTPGGLVQRLEIMGDTKDIDAGDDTGVIVYLNPIKFVSQQVSGCVP